MKLDDYCKYKNLYRVFVLVGSGNGSVFRCGNITIERDSKYVKGMRKEILERKRLEKF